jgi:transcriptional regulator with XRE-family HTH domain
MINMLPNEHLRRERQRRGWSRQYVAEQIGVADPKTIGRWERGVAFPSSYFLQRLCTLYGMLAQDLGLFPADHKNSLPAAGANKTQLAGEFVHDNHMQRHVSDGIIWAGLGLLPNVSDLLCRWSSLLDMPATDIKHLPEEAHG